MKTCRLLLIILTLLITSCITEKEIDFNSFGTQSISNETQKGESLKEMMDYYKVPGISIAVVNDGKLIWAKGYGVANTTNGTKVNPETLFQAGSISKPIAALSVLKLVEQGKVDLDEDVNMYLKGWKIPECEFTKEEKVTLRRLLTHTAGITVHGFAGYNQDDDFPSITSVLKGQGNSGKVCVDMVPGSEWRYSGGGYTIMEKLVEDVSGMPLEEYMAINILQPIGMNNSTYNQPLSSDLISSASAAYNKSGKIIHGLYHNYPEQAAAGLWTTPTDLAKYCMEIQNIMSGKSDGFLSGEIVQLMLTKYDNDWGLGPALSEDGDSLKFGHGGKNAGFTNIFISSVYQHNAIIIMTNGDNGGELIPKIRKSISDYYKMGFN